MLDFMIVFIIPFVSRFFVSKIDIFWHKKWFLGKRVFPRWKLLILIFLGFSCGYMFDDKPYFAVIWTFIMIWDLTKKNSDI